MPYITKETPPQSKRVDKKSLQPAAAWFFGVLLTAFLIYVLLFSPESLPEFKQRIVAILSSLLSATFVFFLTGSLVLQSRSVKTPLGQLTIKSTGSVAVFLLVLWWWFSPFAPIHITKPVYKVRVVVLDAERIPVEDAKVWSSIGVEPIKVAGGWQLEIPETALPLNRRVEIYASLTSAFLSGQAELSLQDDYNPSLTLLLRKNRSAKIRGIIVDKKGRALVGAKVSVVGYEEETVTSSANGSFVLQAHAASGEKVLLHVEFKNFKPVTQWQVAGEKPVTLVLEK